MGKPVVFIHGAWLTPASWDKFTTRFQARGYDVEAPPWPHENMTLADLRRNPPAALSDVGINEIADHYEKIIRAKPTPPVIVGHSFGGLFTQIMLNRGLGSAGVAIDPAPFKGVMPGLGPVLGALPVLFGWNAWKKVHTMPFQTFFTTFANGMPEAEARAAYDKYVAPTPGKLYFDEVLNRGNAIDPMRRKVPLLYTAGGNDKTVTATSVRGCYAKQTASPAITALKYFPDRSHFLCSMPGWEQVADVVLDWLDNPRSGEI
ncbi:MAG TPA: alpha/beta hydrolase [Bauldia sp.]